MKPKVGYHGFDATKRKRKEKHKVDERRPFSQFNNVRELFQGCISEDKFLNLFDGTFFNRVTD